MCLGARMHRCAGAPCAGGQDIGTLSGMNGWGGVGYGWVGWGGVGITMKTDRDTDSGKACNRGHPRQAELISAIR